MINVRTIHTHGRGFDINASIYSITGGYKAIVIVNTEGKVKVHEPLFSLNYTDFVDQMADLVIDLSLQLDVESDSHIAAPRYGAGFSFKSSPIPPATQHAFGLGA